MYYLIKNMRAEQDVLTFARAKFEHAWHDESKAKLAAAAYGAFHDREGPRIIVGEALQEADAAMLRKHVLGSANLKPESFLIEGEALLEPSVTYSYLARRWNDLREGHPVLIVRTNFCDNVIIAESLVYDPKLSAIRALQPELPQAAPIEATPFIARLGVAVGEAALGQEISQPLDDLFPPAEDWVPVANKSIEDIVGRHLGGRFLAEIQAAIEHARFSMMLYDESKSRNRDRAESLPYIHEARRSLQAALSKLSAAGDVTVFDYAIVATQYILVLLELASTTDNPAIYDFVRQFTEETAARVEARMDEVWEDRESRIRKVERFSLHPLKADYYRFVDVHNGYKSNKRRVGLFESRTWKIAKKLAERDRQRYLDKAHGQVEETLKPTRELLEVWEDRIIAVGIEARGTPAPQTPDPTPGRRTL